MAYIARRTRDKAAFLAPLTPCGQQKGAKRQFSPFFADFDQKTQKLHQNKPGIGIAHRFYIEKGITGVISGEVFFYRPPLPLSRGIEMAKTENRKPKTALNVARILNTAVNRGITRCLERGPGACRGGWGR